MSNQVLCVFCGKPIIGGKGDWWHLKDQWGGYGEMRGEDGHLALPRILKEKPEPSRVQIRAGQRYYQWVRQNQAANDDQTRLMVEEYRNEARQLGVAMEKMKIEIAKLKARIKELEDGQL
jgi:hypothetical protein